ncbi:MAG TPA: penicillin-binding protein 1A [Thioalkalivibrio sp.]|nr:penicillin-binding protein 1A [Thioalkalivibrio sp.]
MKLFLRLVRWGVYAALAGVVLGALAIGGAYLYFVPGLPDVDALRETRMQVPLRVYSKEGLLLAEYGEKRRVPLAIEDIPLTLRDAFVAAEDERFYTHPGVDYRGILRAALSNYLSGDRGQGASTITMQVARNFFLSPEKTYTRKLREIFLALKIEKELNKEEILELYLNKIYLGNRSYGVGAAAQVYYAKTVEQLTLPEIAMIAGLPKAPSSYNPIVNPKRAEERRNYVLRRLLELGRIDQLQHDEAAAAPLTAGVYLSQSEVDSPYVGEMVRAVMVERFGEEAYTGGYRVYTTVEAKAQAAATAALRKGLIDYDLRHGYRGPEARVELPEMLDADALEALLQPYSSLGGLVPAVVTDVGERQVRVYVDNLGFGVIPWEGIGWARPYINESAVGPVPASAGAVLAPGDVVRVSAFEGLPEALESDDRTAAAADSDAPPLTYWSLRQLPTVSGALVSLRPEDGALLALIGGFDFRQSKFNRAVQAERQPGSVFKPFIYSAALERDFTPATLVNDAPVVFDDPALEAEWRPENYSGRFYGPTRLRVALTKSRNLVSIRLLQSIGLGYGYRYIERFGFDLNRLPRDLSLALGSGTVTPLEMVRAYGVFANGGYLVEPYFIERIEDGDGEALFTAQPRRACDDCEPEALAVDPVPVADDALAEAGDAGPVDTRPWLPAERVIPAENAYQITSMLRSVIREGTGQRAMALGRNDLSGKTGTTNDGNDAWFSGYNADVATTVWVGFDQLRPLGRGETGASTALPVWVGYMGVVLAGRPEHSLRQPDGMVTVRIDPETGLLAGSDNADAIFETFRADLVPEPEFSLLGGAGETAGGAGGTLDIPEQLF